MRPAMKKILVPSDFSALSTAALRYAGSLAAQTGAELVALYADKFLPPLEFTSGGVEDLRAALADSRRMAKEELERCVGQNVPAGVRTTSVVVEDHPVSAIINYAIENGVDSIVMGTRGGGSIERLLLGSVSERVVAESPVPVTLIPPAAAQQQSATASAGAERTRKSVGVD